MYVFARSRQADPAHGPAAIGLAVELAAKVSSVTGLEVTPWVTVLSPEVGRVTWAAFAEHLADLGAAGDKLMADSAYVELLQKAASLYLGPPSDSVVQLLHGAPSDARPSYAGVVTGELANGHFGDGVMKGIEIAQTAARVTGLSTMFGLAVTGRYAGVAWFTPANDLAELEAGQAALAADSAWLMLIDGSGDLFNSGVEQTLYRRLG